MKRIQALLFALGLSCFALAGAPKATRWVRVQSPNFTLYSNASESQTRKIATDLERFREVLGRMTRGFELEAEVPSVVYVFKNDAALEPYKQDESGKTMNLSGYFLERPFRNYIAIDASAGLQPRRVIYHEFVHSMLHATYEWVPLWLDEGLAEFYSTFEYRASSGSAEVGHTIDEHVLQLRRGGFMAIDELFATRRDSQTYNEEDRQGQFYAQSWFLVYYLVADEQARPHLNHYLGELREGPTDESSLLKAMGLDSVGLQRQLSAYLDGGSGQYWNVREQVEEVPLESTSLAEGEALLRLGELLVQVGPWNAAAAREHLEAALAAEAPASAVQGNLAMLAEELEAYDEAQDRYRKATAGPEPDAEILTRFAWFLVDRHLDEQAARAAEGAAPHAVLEARSLLRKSLELDPDNVETLTVLGRTYLLSADDPDEGVRLLAAANAKRPYREDILYDLACMLAKSGRTRAAWSVVESQLRPKAEDPAIVRDAEAWIVGQEAMEVQRLAQAGDRDGARAVLDRVEQFLRDPELRAQVADLRAVVESDGETLFVSEAEAASMERLVERATAASRLANEGELEQALEIMEALETECGETPICERVREQTGRLRDAVVQNRLVARYNQAVDLANDGKPAAAIEILREVAREATDPGLAEAARTLIRQLGG